MTNIMRLWLSSLGLGLLFAAAANAGSIDVRHHGYEHGFRDGFEYGRDLRARGGALDFNTDAYREADHGYQAIFGSREEFQTGYREGYRIGVDDGFKGVTTRLEQAFSEDRYASERPDQRGNYLDVAADVAYRDGLSAGLKDYRDHRAFRAAEHDAWKDADHGYDRAFGSKDEYRRAYRTAFESGYRDGYSGR